MSESTAGESAAEPADAGDDGGLERPDGPPEWLSLDDGEQLYWVGGPSSATLIPAAVWGMVLLLVFGLGLVVFGASYLSVRNTDYVVTNTTLYHKRGVLSTNIESVGLDRIQNTEYSQSFAGKQLGYGTIEISTAGSGGSDLAFRSIDDPRLVRDLVNRLGPSAGGTAGGGGEAGTGGAGADEELVRELLAELRAVNESMENVERLLREGSGASGASGGAATTRSTASSTGTGAGGDAGASGAGRGAPGSSSTGGASGTGGGTTGGGEGAGGSGRTGSGAGTGGSGSTSGGASAGDGVGETPGGASSGTASGPGDPAGDGAGEGADGAGQPADRADDESEPAEDTAREFIASTDDSDDDDEPPAPPFGGDGG